MLVAALWPALTFSQPLGSMQGDQREPLRNRITALNAALSQTVSSQSRKSSSVSLLLNERARLLAELMETDPQAVFNLALPPEAALQLRRMAPEAEIEFRGDWEGMVEGIVADDFEHHRSQTRWYLRTSNRTFEVYFAGHSAIDSGASVKLSGLSIAGRIAAATIDTTQAAAAAQLQCSTTGAQNIAVLMLTTPSNPTFPPAITPASLRQAFFGSPSDLYTTDSLSGYWQEMSYGLTWAAGQVIGPVALNQDYTCNQTDQIRTAAIQAFDSIVDLTQFTRIALMFPVAACSSYAGMDTLGCTMLSSPTKGNFQASTGWFPQVPNQQPNTPLYVHEIGHGLGLGHSATKDYNNVPLGGLDQLATTVEYGDLFSLMGYPLNGFGISGQYTAPHKGLTLHWLQPGEYQETQSSGTFSLVPYELSSGARALRVLRDPSTNAWLWLEYRQPIGDVDKHLQGMPNSNAFNGALIHYENAFDLGRTYLLDFNPVSTPNDFHDAALTAARSWSDPYSPLTLAITAANSNGLLVNVNYDPTCASVQISQTVFDALGGSGTITVSANATCSWTAFGSSWITLFGQTSGVGSGTISFSVTGNNGGSQRQGFISVGRQSTAIVQVGTNGIAALSVSPNSGIRTSGQFVFQFSDISGFSDINFVSIEFGKPPRNPPAPDEAYCEIKVYPGGNYLYVGTAFLSLAAAGANASDGMCTVYSTGSSITGSGVRLTVTLQVAFSASYSGSYPISGKASGSGTDSGTQLLGIFTVPPSTPFLNLTKTHSGGFTQGQTGATYTITVSNGALAQPTSGSLTVTEMIPAGLSLVSMAGAGWACPAAGTTCARGDVLGPGASYPSITVTVNVAPNAPAQVTNRVSVSGGGSPNAATSDVTLISMAPIYVIAGRVTLFGGGNVSGVVLTLSGSQSGSTTPDASGNYSFVVNPGGTYTVAASLPGYTFAPASLTFNNLTVSQTANFSGSAALQFYPIMPCRVADTRSFTGPPGPLGPPSLAAHSTRSFPVLSSACGIAANAGAYSLNVSAVPLSGYLQFATVWPTGQPMPVASTLNSWDGRIVANGAIIPAGTAGAISIFVSDSADVFVDINGYFGPPGPGSLEFYPMTPCRVADTRSFTGPPGPLGPPSMTANSTRSFPVQSSACGIPISAVAYSMNMSAVPSTRYLGYLTTWGTGRPQPIASTLNSWTGTIVANTAIVPAGMGGAISIYVSDATDVFFDINGYFAVSGARGLQYRPVVPCRIADTRSFTGPPTPLGPPSLTAGSSRSFPVLSSACGMPATAAAYAFNVTAVPTSGYLQYLTTWGTGQPMPVASTLNSWTGTIVPNGALVPAGTGGAISIYVSDPTDVFFDVNGYFAP